MTWHRSRVGAATFLLGALAVGCAARGPAPRTVAAPLADPKEVAAAFAERGRALRSLRALAKVRYTDPQERHSSRQAVVVARPDQIRVEVLSMLGTAFVLTAQGGHLVAYWPEERTLFEGLASAENLWRYTRVWMPVETLIDVLLGTPAAQSAELAPCPSETTSATCLRQDTAGRGALLVALDSRGLPQEVEELGVVDGEVLWRARYLEYTHETVPPAAKSIVIEVPRYRRSVALQLSDVEVNPALPHGVFQLVAPPDARVVDLDAQEVD